ncbi:hypothetical protein [Rhizobium croatiense]|uniref:hypothetical protein n=1 Tax=Rhizobium croatiense TaxID=2867516 RepID=UPI0023EB7336|nr:hypothetical protein [Rhizobium croatiense]WET75393.1 hypothetical protein PYR68_07845 [Rhizobium croatiense]
MQVYFDIRHRDTTMSTNGSNHIVPQHWSSSADDPTPLLSHDCATFAEMEHVINEMIRDLENLRKKARRKFADLEKAGPRPLDLE